MKKGLVVLVALALAGCGGAEDAGSSGLGSAAWSMYYCPTETRTNVGGQTIDTGSVSVINDDDELIVTITGTDGWLVDEWHVYAGTGPVPVNRAGNPAPGKFPYHGDPSPALNQVVVRIPFSALGAACEDLVNLAVHSVMKKSAGGISAEETAWADWDVAFTGSRWGGSFGYAICCNDVPPPPPPADACVLPAYYWGQTPAIWPAFVSTITLGARAYSVTELLDLLALDWWILGGDVSVMLGQQVIAARLNEAKGVVLPADVVTSLLEAELWLAAATDQDGDGRIPFGILQDTVSPAILGHLDFLESFNRGQGALPKCY